MITLFICECYQPASATANNTAAEVEKIAKSAAERNDIVMYNQPCFFVVNY